jgi:carbon-monoxide dehydrogenase medium subunit
VKPPPFAYHRPDTLERALELLRRDPEARALAGGQSLVPLMKLRTVKPTALVDLNALRGLDGIEERDGALRIGALTRLQAVVNSGHPLLARAVAHAGYLATRHRGTVGGSLAYAAPWAELCAAVVLLDAQLETRSTSGTRTIAAREFFRGPYETALEPGEVITAVVVPAAPPHTGFGFHEVSPRFRDFATIVAAASVTRGDSGACTAAELVLLRVASMPYRADVSQLVGTQVGDVELESLAGSLADIDPPTDIEASSEHRRRLALTLARRAVRDAAENAGGGA